MRDNQILHKIPIDPFSIPFWVKAKKGRSIPISYRSEEERGKLYHSRGMWDGVWLWFGDRKKTPNLVDRVMSW